MFKYHLVQRPCNKQGHLPRDQVAQTPIQSNLDRFKEWGIYRESTGFLFFPLHIKHLTVNYSGSCRKTSDIPMMVQDRLLNMVGQVFGLLLWVKVRVKKERKRGLEEIRMVSWVPDESLFLAAHLFTLFWRNRFCIEACFASSLLYISLHFFELFLTPHWHCTKGKWQGNPETPKEARGSFPGGN